MQNNNVVIKNSTNFFTVEYALYAALCIKNVNRRITVISRIIQNKTCTANFYGAD
ncbi:hypothetical protein PUN28_004705 [Cardiocondyla obscurior]|uniref:Uncharacterized protein n=1 Tax=Cardiocondyla obscurior TaxID=286306 RepID=A0AAW2GE36_9HYME